MRFLIMLSAVVWPMLAADAAAVDGEIKPYRAAVTGERVHVRAGPSRNFTSLKFAAKGDPLWVVGVKGKWARISVPDDCVVYISRKLVDRADDVGLVKGDRCNVRAKPDAKANVLGQVNKGTPVEILGAKGKWLEIRPPKGVTAWIYARYVDPPPPGAIIDE